MVKALLAVHGKKSPNKASILGLGGDFSEISRNRELGLIQEIDNIEYLNQIVNTMWDRVVAQSKLKGLLQRYPDTNIIWAASDELALAALDFVEKSKMNDVVIGGIGWLPQAIKMIDSGKVDATVGGHFMQAAWALVKIFDHSKGLNAFANKAPYPII